MPLKPQQQRRTNASTPDSLPKSSENLPGDLRHSDQPRMQPDQIPPSTDEEEGPAASSLAPDGGVAEHPIHDDDPAEDFTPRDYEKQIDEVAEAARRRADRAGKDEQSESVADTDL